MIRFSLVSTYGKEITGAAINSTQLLNVTQIEQT